MQYKLSHLLPYSANAHLESLHDRIQLLHLLVFFYRSTQDAIKKFLAGEYHCFDAQVSENLCQTRAYQLVQILHHEKDCCLNLLPPFLRVVRNAYVKCTILLTAYTDASHKRRNHCLSIINRPIALQELLQHYRFNLNLSSLVFFLLHAYILSRYKSVGDYNIFYGINYDKLCEEIKIPSKAFVKKVIHFLQRNISKQSCQMIFGLLTNFTPSFQPLQLLKSLHFQDEIGRHMLACYETTKIILQHAFQSNLVIKMVINRIAQHAEDQLVFFLHPSQTKQCYVLASENINFSTGIMTFIGIVRYNEPVLESKEKYFHRFFNTGFENIILSNMAQHPQYAGLLLDNKKYNPYFSAMAFEYLPHYLNYIQDAEKQFLRHKYMSSIIGCTPENSSLFLLTHVRCEAVDGQFEKTELARILDVVL